MAEKTATVAARIDPEIKRQAEAILGKLGFSVSTLIDSLYRQIIITKGVPFSITLPNHIVPELLTDAEINKMLDRAVDRLEEIKGQKSEEAVSS